MSRWFRHYSGMMRDEKLVSAAVKSKQPVHLVVWVWGAILESASEVQDGGRYEFDCDEAAYFLRCEGADITNILDALETLGRVHQGVVVRWSEDFIDADRPSPHRWSIIRTRVFERDDYTCQYCGARGGKLECDHVHPVARGGQHDDSNLVTACLPCNRSKRDKFLHEWLQ